MAFPGELKSQVWWDYLTDREKNIVEKADEELSKTAHKMLRGKYLATIRSVLRPKSLWMAYRDMRGARTADRYINSYLSGRKYLSEAALDVAIKLDWLFSGSAPLGIYTDAVEKYPPPDTEDRSKLVEWGTMIQKIVSDTRSVKRWGDRVNYNKDDIRLAALRSVRNALSRIKESEQEEWTEELVSNILAEFGQETKPRTVKPVQVSSKLRQRLSMGRPRNNRGAAKI